MKKILALFALHIAAAAQGIHAALAPIIHTARRVLAYFAPNELPPLQHEYAAPLPRVTARLTRNHRDQRREMRMNLSPRHCIS